MAEVATEEDGWEDILCEGPFGDMLNFYDSVSCGHAIWPLMEVCARRGVLFSSPEAFIMARPVNSTIPELDIINLKDLHPDYQNIGLTDAYDAWHVIYASGDLRHFFDKATHPLPFVLWQRNGVGKLKRYSFNKIKQKIHHGKHT